MLAHLVLSSSSFALKWASHLLGLYQATCWVPPYTGGGARTLCQAVSWKGYTPVIRSPIGAWDHGYVTHSPSCLSLCLPVSFPFLVPLSSFASGSTSLFPLLLCSFLSPLTGPKQILHFSQLFISIANTWDGWLVMERLILAQFHVASFMLLTGLWRNTMVGSGDGEKPLRADVKALPSSLRASPLRLHLLVL